MSKLNTLYFFVVLISVSHTVEVNCQSNVTINLYQIIGYSGYEDVIKAAKAEMEFAINSVEFKNAVLKGNYDQTKGLSNVEMYQVIMSAHETRGPGRVKGRDGVIEFGIRTMSLEKDGKKWMRKCRKKKRRTIGKEGGQDGIIITCPNSIEYWRKRNRVDKMARHFLHEYLHILGFSHKDGKPKSAVYKISKYLAQIVKENSIENAPML